MPHAARRVGGGEGAGWAVEHAPARREGSVCLGGLVCRASCEACAAVAGRLGLAWLLEPGPPLRLGQLRPSRRSVSNMATANDRAVLQSIFHPDTPFGEISAASEQEQPKNREEGEGGAFAPELLEEATQLEIQGVAAAEAGDLRGALESFGRAIQLLPERASAYNNRAQALRLQGDVAGALEDLDVVLRLSEGAGHVARQGFVQRGLIRRLQGQEEAARRDLEQAAHLGSSFARRQLVLLNPYAALCNQMLSEVMKALCGPTEGPQPRGGKHC